MILTLLDGEHEIGKPSLYVLELMADYGVDVFDEDSVEKFTDPKQMLAIVPAMLAAFLTAAEPLGSDLEPERVWMPQEVKRLIPLDGILEIGQTLVAIVGGSFPDAEEQKGATTRPTNGRARAPKQ
jgi:hypothetical protein